MPITHYWVDDEQTILCWRFEGNWDIEEYKEAFIAMSDEIRKRDHSVDMVADLLDSWHPPSKAFSLAGFVNRHIADNMRLHIPLVSNAFMRTMLDMGKKLKLAPALTKNMHFARDWDEAYHIIERERANFG